MKKIIGLLFPLLAACQSAQAGSSNPTTSLPGSPQTAQTQGLSAGEVTPEGSSPAESVQEEQVAIATAFEAQPFDEAWRVPREARLRSAVTETQGGTSLESVECRQTLCKLVVRTSGGRSTPLRHAITQAFDDNDGFLMEHSFVVYGSADRSQSTIYISRNHYRLPDKNGVVEELPKKRAGQ